MYKVDGQGKQGVIVFAHGAGLMMDAPWMNVMAEGLAATGWAVLRFEFEYMQKRRQDGRRRPPDALPLLEACMLEAVNEAAIRWPGKPIVLAGKSLGGRVAVHCARHTSCRAVVVFGYPFHPIGKPTQLRLAPLQQIEMPTLIVQGERDPFGRYEEVAQYCMNQCVTVHWLASADHDFKPLKKSGLTQAGLQTSACTRALDFIGEVIQPCTG